jgi:hypothetical protein
MYALIHGYPDGDGYLVERVLGIYDSEESVPDKYKEILLKNIKTSKDAYNLETPIYCGTYLTESNKIIFEYGKMDCIDYYRLQFFEINQPLKLIEP